MIVLNGKATLLAYLAVIGVKLLEAQQLDAETIGYEIKAFVTSLTPDTAARAGANGWIHASRHSPAGRQGPLWRQKSDSCKSLAASLSTASRCLPLPVPWRLWRGLCSNLLDALHLIRLICLMYA